MSFVDATTRLESSNRPACAQARFQTFQSVPSRPRVEHVLHYTLLQRLPDRFLAGHRISWVSSPPLPDTDVLSGVSSQTHLPFRPISWLLGIFVRPSALQPSQSLRFDPIPQGPVEVLCKTLPASVQSFEFAPACRRIGARRFKDTLCRRAVCRLVKSVTPRSRKRTTNATIADASNYYHASTESSALWHAGAVQTDDLTEAVVEDNECYWCPVKRCGTP